MIDMFTITESAAHGENMHREPGTTTRDLRSHARDRQETPEQLEKTTRLFGAQCLIAGCLTIVITIIATLSAALLTDARVFTSPIGQLFAVLALAVMFAGGTTLVGAGCAERLQRATRATALQNSRRLDKIEEIIEKVPQHGQAILAGVELGARAFRPDPAGD